MPARDVDELHAAIELTRTKLQRVVGAEAFKRLAKDCSHKRLQRPPLASLGRIIQAISDESGGLAKPMHEPGTEAGDKFNDVIRGKFKAVMKPKSSPEYAAYSNEERAKADLEAAAKMKSELNKTECARRPPPRFLPPQSLPAPFPTARSRQLPSPAAQLHCCLWGRW